jgi:hypothetical protein
MIPPIIARAAMPADAMSLRRMMATFFSFRGKLRSRRGVETVSYILDGRDTLLAQMYAQHFDEGPQAPLVRGFVVVPEGIEDLLFA